METSFLFNTAFNVVYALSALSLIFWWQHLGKFQPVFAYMIYLPCSLISINQYCTSTSLNTFNFWAVLLCNLCVGGSMIFNLCLLGYSWQLTCSKDDTSHP